MTKEKIQDYTLRISNANKTEMVVILYDIAITYLQDAIEKADSGDIKEFRKEVERVRATIKELMNSLDTSIDIGKNLLSLYVFCSGELTKAFLDRDKDALYHVMSILTKLREAYATISPMDKSKPVMEHAEKMYSGLTYNRNMMNENSSILEGNRGFLA